MTCYHRLNISPKGALKVDLRELFLKQQGYDISNYEAEGITLAARPYRFWTEDLFDEQWLNELKSKLPVPLIKWSIVFYRSAEKERTMAGHVDLCDLDPGDRDLNDRVPLDTPRCMFNFALNFTLTDNDTTEMIWFDRVNGQLDFNDPRTAEFVPYEDLKEIQRGHIGSDHLVLVRTDKYHDVDHKSQDRWCVSLRCEPDIPWEEAEKLFAPLFLENDQ